MCVWDPNCRYAVVPVKMDVDTYVQMSVDIEIICQLRRDVIEGKF